MTTPTPDRNRELARDIARVILRHKASNLLPIAKAAGAYDEVKLLLAQREAEIRTECEKESAHLAANQCHDGYGDAYGNHRCVYQDRIAELEHMLRLAKGDDDA